MQRPTIGLLLPVVGGYYYTGVLAGIKRIAKRRGVRVVAFQTSGMEVLWPTEEHTRPLGWDRIDGWIGVTEGQAVDYYELISRSRKPLVLVSARLPHLSVSTVLPDNFGGTAAAVRHLIEHGHRRIGFVGNQRQSDIRERLDGYLAALREAGIEPDPELIFETGCNLELAGRDMGAHLLRVGLPCTAIVTGTDLNALGVMHALQVAQRRVPDDLAVIGFDDIEPAQYFDPPLATVRQRFDLVGEAAATALLNNLLDGAALPAELRVPTTLIRRLSCGCKDQMLTDLDVTTESDAGRRVEALADKLLLWLTADRRTGVPSAGDGSAGALRLARHLDAVVRGAAGLDLHELRESWCDLLSVTHDVGSVERLSSLVERTAMRWLAGEGSEAARTGSPAEERLYAALRQVRLEMMRAWRIVEQNWRQYYDAVAEANRKINLSLIGADLESAQSLAWLELTRVKQGSLGLWEPESPTRPRQLRIVGVFGAQARSAPLLGTVHAPDQFPPPTVYETLDALPDEDLLSIIPIAGRGGRNRGLLTVIGPIEIEMFDDMGSLGQWAALLSAAMDRGELLESLREGFERERRFARTLRESEERYALAARGANDGLWDWNISTGEVYYSPRWKAILGYAEHEIGHDIQAWFSRVYHEDLPDLQQRIEEHCAGLRPHIEHEYRMAHKDGSYRWVLCRGVAVHDGEGRAVRLAGSQTETTSRKEAEEQLRQNALHDALTGLPNRALLIARLEQAILQARRNENYRFAVLFLDLDRFKTINDGLGHLAGDQLLIEIARRLRACLRASDLVARLGGDEFAVLVDLAESGDASLVAERIQKALSAPFNINGHQVFSSSSIGITLSSAAYERAEDFLRDSDTAMYRAKNQGRARHELFDARMHDQAMARLRIEADLRRAIEREEFLLHYQPLVSLHTDRVIGVEALIRWLHPEQGFLSPAAFLPVAEETGLIVPISHWVLRTACRQMKVWEQELGELVRVSVNVPSQQLKEPGFIELVRKTLLESRLSAAGLGIELVESSLIENRETTVEVLQDLQDMGVYIAVDDFGTGYSSLSYLKRFPLNALKIDRSFIQGVPDDPNDTAISNAIIAMAKNLNLTVVAEGVETKEQIEFLRAHGCDILQGYFLSRPLAAEACLAFLKRRQRSSIVARIA